MGRLGRWVAGTLVVAALGIAGVQGARSVAARTLAPFAHPVQGVESMATFRGEIERCQLRDGRWVVRGWIVRPGAPRGPHATRVLLRNEADGRLYVLPTDLPKRSDVNARLAAELHDGIDYTRSGFVASVDLARVQPVVAGARIFIAYDEGDARIGAGYVLVPTDCIAA